MGDSFESKSKSIGELLGVYTRTRLEVPTFQRGYSWGKKHVEAFWSDISQFQSESSVSGGPRKYFLGPIVTLQEENSDVVQLLDGQQRMATTTILLSVLRDVAKTVGTN